MTKYAKAFLEKQKEILLEEKNNLEDKIKKLRTYQDFGFDDEDNTDEITNYENNLSIGTQIGVLLAKVNKALKAIENGTYGKCINCGEYIEQGRLEVMPYAEICVKCKEKESK